MAPRAPWLQIEARFSVTSRPGDQPLHQILAVVVAVVVAVAVAVAGVMPLVAAVRLPCALCGEIRSGLAGHVVAGMPTLAGLPAPA